MCGFVSILGKCHDGELAHMSAAVAGRGLHDQGNVNPK